MLLKRWKRLEAGYTFSSDAYEALSEHYHRKTDQWLRDEKRAQRERKNTPASMDIYDTTKTKGVDTDPDISAPSDIFDKHRLEFR
jgi:hypothetical protein